MVLAAALAAASVLTSLPANSANAGVTGHSGYGRGLKLVS